MTPRASLATHGNLEEEDINKQTNIYIKTRKSAKKIPVGPRARERY
jgi:hypothetical protein